MKIRKNAEQKNFIVDKDFYTEYELLSVANVLADWYGEEA